MLDVERRTFHSFDGTEISYYLAGNPDGPAVVFANGLGGPISSYRHLMRQLGERFRLVSWDYRGLYNSGRPPRLNAVGMNDQLRDLEQLLALTNVKRALFVGWSMGVQVCLETFRRYRDRVSGLVLMCGAPGRPFLGIPGGGAASLALPPLLNFGKRNAGLAARLAKGLTGWKPFVPLMQRAGLVADSLDMQIFRDISAEFASLDFAVYLETLKQLNHHDAWPVLTQVDVPTLIIAGGKDLMTPARTAKSMHEAVAGSRLLVIQEGTHYTPVEFPERIEREMESFLGAHPDFDAQNRVRVEA
jgi:pimeloyl-ACP methyl ester carboxylesterase